VARQFKRAWFDSMPDYIKKTSQLWLAFLFGGKNMTLRAVKRSDEKFRKLWFHEND
jgi:hypothetical protein